MPCAKFGVSHFIIALVISATLPPTVRSAPSELRVCADPNNLPFSDSKGNGFENKLAELIAQEIGKTLSYTWWAQRRGFIRNTLGAGLCDLVIGVPVHYDPVATTHPYYRSSYVFVSRADRAIDIVSLKDPRLRTLRIGVQLVGDDGMNTPPAHALGELGIIENVVGYMVYGDYRQASPQARLIDAVATGEIDLAAAWGPSAGYGASRSAVPLQIHPIEGTDQFAPLQFAFDIAMGVRKTDHVLAGQLNSILQRKKQDIAALLESYAVPLAPRGPDRHAD